MNFLSVLYYSYNKQFLDQFGIFFADFYMFSFELFYIITILTLLIFFVFLSNRKLSGRFVNVSQVLLNLILFSSAILIWISCNSFDESFYLFAGFYYNDPLITFFKLFVLFAFFFFLFAFKFYISSVNNYDFEFILLAFISLFSSILLLNTNDLTGLFFVIELQSLTLYILVSSKQTSSLSTESGLKYFILGCFSSGLILFGISLIYGFTGLLSYDDLSLYAASGFLNLLNSYVSTFTFVGFAIGLLFLTVGILFKLGAAPFHMWMPDVYEGSPMIITFYLSTVSKIPLIFIFFKLYYSVFAEFFYFYQFVFLLSAILSIVIGSIAAIYQLKIKRLLTYSMITNTGYLLFGLSLGDVSAIYVTLFYFISYIFIMFGLFFCFMLLVSSSNNLLVKKINTLINLFEINPALAFSLFLLLFSIAGVPPLLGFYSKLFLFLYALKLKYYWLTILFVIFSVISVFYYIRLVKLMYFNRSGGWLFFKTPSFSICFLISFITIVNFIFFVNPNLIFKLIYNFSFYFFL